jgi:radical SAM protein with 4Fe4S-binding SPASM domain
MSVQTLANITAVLSMLHEPADRNSATRLFRGRPVLGWTLDRLNRAELLTSKAILCWEDQLDAVLPLAEQLRADVLAKGPRVRLPELEAISASRRWADGWRGGLLGACEFDRGFHAGWIEELATKLESEAVVLVDPSAGLIDPGLVDSLVNHAEQHSDMELCFMPAAAGLAGTLLRVPLLKRLATAKSHPGRLMNYSPDTISREPLAGHSCAPVPAIVARTTDRFTLDSDRQVERINAATISLNGQLISSPAAEIVTRARDIDRIDSMPREVVLEINTLRASSPIFWPGRHHPVQRANLTRDQATHLFEQLALEADDIRLTLAGVGDPLLSDAAFPIIAAARRCGIAAIHVETDLLQGDLAQLAASDVDVVSFHVPAMTPQTYATVMGVDRYAQALENVRTFLSHRAQRSRGVPILVPTFTKCQQNLGEMEAWYDQWLRAVGTAVIAGPSDYAGQIPDVAVADMSPPKRTPCRRLWSRMVIHSDGNVVACEQDFVGRSSMGNAFETPLKDIWQNKLASLRVGHRSASYGSHPLCGGCREWHRP